MTKLNRISAVSVRPTAWLPGGRQPPVGMAFGPGVKGRG